jgi:hypothetical protein
LCSIIKTRDQRSLVLYLLGERNENGTLFATAVMVALTGSAYARDQISIVGSSVLGLPQIMKDLVGRRCGLQHRLFYYGLYGTVGICMVVIYHTED